MATVPTSEPGTPALSVYTARVYDEPGTVEAQCRIDLGPVTTVPYTVLPPV